MGKAIGVAAGWAKRGGEIIFATGSGAGALVCLGVGASTRSIASGGRGGSCVTGTDGSRHSRLDDR